MTFKIYYNDNVNEPALLGVKSSLNEAKKMADKEADMIEWPMVTMWTCLPVLQRHESRSMKATSILS